MPKKKITIDDLAVMVQGGFTELRTEMDNKFADLRTGMEKGFSEVHNDLADIRDELTGVKVRLGAVERRLDDVVDDHGHRIKKLETHLKTNP
jgi:hypothetical protein